MCGEAVEDDAGAYDEVERGVRRGELGRTEADLEGVAEEFCAEDLRAVDAVVLAQRCGCSRWASGKAGR